MTDLLKKDAPWNEVQMAAFNEMKARKVNEPILHAIRTDLEFVVRTDASKRAIGAVLPQYHDGILMPTAYLSHKLTSAEMNYSVSEQECLAVVIALREWRVFPDGVKFLVESDH